MGLKANIGLFFLQVIFMNNYDKVSIVHTKSVKYVMSGAAPLGFSDAERFKEVAPNASFFQGYGLTEASPVVLMSMLGSKNYASVGRLSKTLLTAVDKS